MKSNPAKMFFGKEQRKKKRPKLAYGRADWWRLLWKKESIWTKSTANGRALKDGARPAPPRQAAAKQRNRLDVVLDVRRHRPNLIDSAGSNAPEYRQPAIQEGALR